MLSIAAILDLHLFSFDVASAFLHSTIHEEVYMRRPKGLNDSQMDPIVKLKKCIYGLKQAAFEWRQHLHTTLLSLNFKQNRSDNCVYRKDDLSGNFIILCTHVDDVLCASNSIEYCNAFQVDIQRTYEITINNPLTEFLGMSITRNRDLHSIHIAQPGYLLTMRDRYGYLLAADQDTNPAVTPMSAVFPKPSTPNQDFLSSSDQTLYMSLVGSLMYASVMTRDDIKQCLSYLATAMKQATQHHLNTAIRCLSYLLGTSTLGRTFGGPSSTLTLWATADASYACHDDRKSHFGISLHLGPSSGAFHSVSKKAKVMALSSTEAEYIALFETAKLIAWARQFLADLGFKQTEPTTVYEDNLSTIHLVEHGNDKGKTKHMDVRFHFIKELVDNGAIKLQHRSTLLMIADMLTKALASTSFLRLRPYLLGTLT
jgi:hypothetical protein